jgi:hypothetical protein
MLRTVRHGQAALGSPVTQPAGVAASSDLQLLVHICISTTNALLPCWPGKLLVSMQQQ